MEIVVGIAVIAIVIWLVARRKDQSGPSTSRSGAKARAASSDPPKQFSGSDLRREIDAALTRDYSAATQPGVLSKVERRLTEEHVPPSPASSSVEAWSPRTQQLEVAGEWYRAENLRSLFTRHATVSESGDEIHLPAVLVPDPSNPYDKRAVAVFVDGLHVGYMERPQARRYHAAISKLPGGELTVPSRQWLRGTDDDTWARVTLSLPDPAELQCPNPTKGEHIVLPPGSTDQVTKEEDHMEHLANLLKQYGTDRVLAATLRRITEQRPRSTVELVAVEIDCLPVGVLSKIQTANFLPLVRRAEAEGARLVCRASLRGNALKADVALHARKAQDLDDQDLETLFGAA